MNGRYFIGCNIGKQHRPAQRVRLARGIVWYVEGYMDVFGDCVADGEAEAVSFPRKCWVSFHADSWCLEDVHYGMLVVFKIPLE